MSQDPYAEYKDGDVSQSDMDQLNNMIDQYVAARARAAQLIESLKQAEEQLTNLATRLIPEKMDELQLKSFETKAGKKVSIKESTFANTGGVKNPIRHDKCLVWLEENGHASLIKRKISVGFNVDQQDEAMELLKQIQDDYDVNHERNVHPQTLNAFVREQLEEGLELPDIFGVFVRKEAKISG